MAKLSPKLKEYQTQLGELKSKVTEFDRYYKGVSGVWTSQHKSLRAVWDSKTEMTKDKDTKLRCSRLQQDIREVVTRLESITRSIEKICDDKSNPEVIRTAAALETMKEFREAIQRNEVDDYDKYKPLVMRLN
jgi:phytoene/squalene synthetase